MLSTLAQADTPPAEAAKNSFDLWAQAGHVFETSIDIFSRGDTLASPSELIPELAQLGEVWAIVFVILGLVCLIKGYTFHKVMTVSLLVILGAMLGYWMGIEIQGPPFVVAGCVAVLLAVLAFPLMKYAVAVLGGLSGAFIGSNLWAGLGRVLDTSAQQRINEQGAEAASGSMVVKIAEAMPADAYWAGALIGLMVCGLAAFALSKITIHLFTTVSGSTIAVFGVIALLLSINGIGDTVATELSKSPLVLPLLVFVPAAIGFLMQEKASGAWGGGQQAAPA
jgi:hypothetical protein